MKKRAIQIFLKKPFREKFFLIKVTLFLAWYRFFILSFSFNRLANKLGEQNDLHKNTGTEPDSETFRLAKNIRNISRIVPWESKCLVQAVVAKIFLRKRGIGSTLYLGVRKSEENSTLQAHAWLDVGDTTILGGENSDQFTVVSSYT